MTTAGSRTITVGRDANGNAFVTGDNNVIYVFYGVEPSAEIIAKIQSGALRPANAPGAVPLPTLTLALAFTDETRSCWEIRAHRPSMNADPSIRRIATLWKQDNGFADRLDTFWHLSRRSLGNEDEGRQLEHAAQFLGNELAGMLADDERALLTVAGSGGPPPPFLVIESDDNMILALPWELLRLNGAFSVREGVLDIARCVTIDGDPLQLEPPQQPVRLLVNVSAPANSAPIDYETESYHITRALQGSVGIVVNEMGEVADLIAGMRADPPPVGVHFSGHGGPGILEFEDEFGEKDPVPVDHLLRDIRTAVDRLPAFFYLACCHGGDAPSLRGGKEAAESGITAVATALHREGVPQVAAYFGPVYDRLSMWASATFYREIARGRRTRDALRVAREEMTRPLASELNHALRDADTFGDPKSLPFGWAQLVLYHRGRDYPLGTRISDAPLDQPSTDTTRRALTEAFPGARTRVLQEGFIGRRKELHDLRRSIKSGRNLHVVQGLGGLGKSAFCNEALRLYGRLGWQRLALWCADAEEDADPTAALLRQFEQLGMAVLGAEAWVIEIKALDQWAIHEPERQRPSRRLIDLCKVILRQENAAPVVLYLDNLESLQKKPDGGNASVEGAWRDGECRALWNALKKLAEEQPARFAIVASARYRNRDFVGVVVPLGPLSDDAMWRLMGWFPALRRLSASTRARLVKQLAGHPRSVELLDGLLGDAVAAWEDNNDRLETVQGLTNRNAWAEREWSEIVAPALPNLKAKLSEDLLFKALWRLLEPLHRDLLVRATALRVPADRARIHALCEPVQQGARASNRLRDVSLLTEISERTPPHGTMVNRFTIHPSVATLALEIAEGAQAVRDDGHRRAGDFLEAGLSTSTSGQDLIEAAYHLNAVGEADRALALLVPLADLLAQRGYFLDSLSVTRIITRPEHLSNYSKAKYHSLRSYVLRVNADWDGSLAEAMASLELRQPLAMAQPDDLQLQSDLALSHERAGDALFHKKKLDEALSHYETSLKIRKQLAEDEPRNLTWQRNISTSHNKVGDIKLAQGNAHEALYHYHKSLALRELLKDIYIPVEYDDIGRHWPQRRDVPMVNHKLGEAYLSEHKLDDALEAFEVALREDKKLAAADNRSPTLQHDLARDYIGVGDALFGKGKLAASLQRYRLSLEISEKFSTAFPKNRAWQHTLFLCHQRIGGVLLEQKHFIPALDSYRVSLKIIEQLATCNQDKVYIQQDLRENLEILSSIYIDIGDRCLEHDQPEMALENFRQSLVLSHRVADTKPADSHCRRSVSVRHNRVGDALLALRRIFEARAQYEAGLKIIEDLLESETSNIEWNRDLSVSHIRMGDAYHRERRISDALSGYRKSLEIRTKLAADDPNDLERQRDISVSHNNIGNALFDKGDFEGALISYQADITIAERLATRDPANPKWQHDLCISYANISATHERIGGRCIALDDLPGALANYQQGLAVRERMAASDPSNTEWQRSLAVSRGRVGALMFQMEGQAVAGQALSVKGAELMMALADANRLPASDAPLVDQLRRWL